MFKDKECNCITYVIQNLMPLPYCIKDIESSKYDKTYRILKQTFIEDCLTIIESKDRLYVDALEDVNEEVIRQMGIYGYNIIGLK